ncbi:hypothetical protein Taro_001956 [Colocasia esculenta]|uniref:Uncharacterized protein n=1 Tax=Colocasia esculenta TaxID=4460 RepID=A0A843TJJ8_COLES|nr:hypothetical protein [Colocasia esculenta]
MDPDDCILRNIRANASSFDGSLDKKVYLDWEARMDHYFDYFELSEPKKVRFAKMKLLGQAKTFWSNVESILHERSQESIDS